MPRKANLKNWLPAFALVSLLALAGCGHRESAPGPAATEERPSGSLDLLFPYGSEKQNWIEDVTKAFNASRHKTAAGKPIFVRALPMGSGETIDEILAGRLRADIASPASAAFVKLGNAQARARSGRDLIPSTENLVLSPVVIALWKPMAEALGWPGKPIGWSDIIALARNPKGWSAYNYPQWGQFKFGHTHPQYSNSGLISLIAEVYAASGKTKGLTMDDIRKPHTGEFVNAIEDSVVHYGSSTGFFGRKMFDNGPQYLSAAVLYESMVVESYTKAEKLAFPVVAIYPKEGTFWSDHPIGVVDREWVTPEHREAARIYIQYLLDKPQQEKALTYGFRPAAVDVAVGAPIDAAHGVDPKEPKTTLEVPSADLIHSILDLWQSKKKEADVVLVLDISGSMNDEHKLENAKLGARQLVNMLSDADMFSLLPFSNTYAWAATDLVLKNARAQGLQQVDSLFAHGGTALYDSIDAAYQHLYERRGERRIQAVVVLTDGEDNESKLKLEDLMSRVRFDGENHVIRIFTIAYGKDANTRILKEIAEGTQAKSYEGNPTNIAGVFRDISMFF